MTVRVLPYGDRALLAQATRSESVLALAQFARGLEQVTAVVPAARTVLVEVASGPSVRQEVTARLLEFDEAGNPTPPAGRSHRIAVHYDGEDLPLVAQQTGLTAAEVIELHTGAEYRVAFCGFAPGFGYLSGLAPQLHRPRLATPRVRVPNGAVAIASEYSAVYPRASPGGWLLLGRTDAVLWDLDRPGSPALLAPGDTVRFDAVQFDAVRLDAVGADPG